MIQPVATPITGNEAGIDARTPHGALAEFCPAAERHCRAAAVPSSLQRLLPRFGNELIAGATAHEMSEAGEVQVHAGDRQPVGRHHVEHAPARESSTYSRL